jgi:hypothetical protein
MPASQVSLVFKGITGSPLLPVARSLSPNQRTVPDFTESDFEAFCHNPDVVFNPRELGFLPLHWPDGARTFGELYARFFKRKNTSRSRFLHKLFNALKIGEIDPRCREFVGVEWVSDDVLRVNKTKFARLLGIKTIDGSLFHRQGNFPSHGFVELTMAEARRMLQPDLLRDVDFDEVRLVRHEPRVFVRGCGPEVDLACKWINGRKSTDARGACAVENCPGET